MRPNWSKLASMAKKKKKKNISAVFSFVTIPDYFHLSFCVFIALKAVNSF